VIEFDLEKEIVEPRRGPDLTPLIDMVFILLVFFLLTSIFVYPRVDVNLPESESGIIEEAEALTVAVLADGGIEVNGRAVTVAELPPLLSALFSERKDNSLVIQADRSIDFGRVVTVMDLAKQAGAGELSFLVERPQQP